MVTKMVKYLASGLFSLSVTISTAGAIFDYADSVRDIPGTGSEVILVGVFAVGSFIAMKTLFDEYGELAIDEAWKAKIKTRKFQTYDLKKGATK